MDDPKKMRVALDADTAGHYLVFLAEYHSWLTLRWESGEIEGRDYADTCYLIGNIEGRTLYGGLTQEDIELLEAWEEEYEERH